MVGDGWTFMIGLTYKLRAMEIFPFIVERTQLISVEHSISLDFSPRLMPVICTKIYGFSWFYALTCFSAC